MSARDDLCPCNSGRKFKDCHMRQLQPKEKFSVNVSGGNMSLTKVTHDGGETWTRIPGVVEARIHTEKRTPDNILVDGLLKRIVGSTPSRQRIIRLRVQRLRHKILGIQYHLNNFREEEDKEKTQLSSNYIGTEIERVVDDPKLIFEIEGFLFQIKSALDLLAQIISIEYSLGTPATYTKDGNALINALRNTPKDKREIASKLAELLERHKIWVKDTVDMRDEVTHFSDLVGFSCFIRYVWDGGGTATIAYPSMPDGERARKYMERTLESLLALINEASPLINSEMGAS